MTKEKLIEELLSLKGLNPEKSQAAAASFEKMDVTKLQKLIQDEKSKPIKTKEPEVKVKKLVHDEAKAIQLDREQSPRRKEYYERNLSWIRIKHNFFSDPLGKYGLDALFIKLEMHMLFLKMRDQRRIFTQSFYFPIAMLSAEEREKYNEYINLEEEAYNDEVQNLLMEGLRVPNKIYHGTKPNATIRKAAIARIKSRLNSEQFRGIIERYKYKEKHVFMPYDNTSADKPWLSRDCKKFFIEEHKTIISMGRSFEMLDLLNSLHHEEKELRKAIRDNDQKAIEKFTEHVELTERLKELFKL